MCLSQSFITVICTSQVTHWVKNSPAMLEMHVMQVQSLRWGDPLEERTQTTPVFLPGESPKDRAAWQATVHSIAKSQTLLKLLSNHAHMH